MKKIIKLLLIIIWLIIIFMFSNQNGLESTNLTNGLLEKYLFFIHSDFIFILIRKLAHITEYFILGILVINFINEFNIDKKIIISIFICFILASLDEFHQLFVIGRTGQLLDVFIDMVGFTLGIVIFIIVNKKILKH